MRCIRLILSGLLLLGVAVPLMAVEDGDPRSAGLGLAGNAQFSYDEETPIIENVACAVMSDGNAGGAGLFGMFDSFQDESDLEAQMFSLGVTAKHLFLLADFMGTGAGYGGRMFLGFGFQYDYGQFRWIDSSLSDDYEFTIAGHYARIRPLFSYGFVDQFAVGIGIDISFRYETVGIEYISDADWERTYDIAYSPTFGILITPRPTFQIGLKFDLGYLSDEQTADYEIGDVDAEDHYYAVEKRVVGGGIAYSFPAYEQTTLAVDVDYIFPTEEDGLDIILPAIEIQAGLEKRWEAFVFRFGGGYFAEQEDNGWNRYSGSFGFSYIKEMFNYNLAVSGCWQENPDLEYEGYRLGVFLGAAF